MATAVKLALVPPPPDPDDALSAAELVERFTASELLAASQEISPTYDGLVLARAVVIVQCRLHCMHLQDLARRMGAAKIKVYRWASGKLLRRHSCFEMALRELAFLLAER